MAAMHSTCTQSVPAMAASVAADPIPALGGQQVFALAFMQGNGGEIPRDPGIRTRGARTRDPR